MTDDKKFQISKNPDDYDVIRKNGYEVKFKFGTVDEREKLSLSVAYFNKKDNIFKIGFTAFKSIPSLVKRLYNEDEILIMIDIFTANHEKIETFTYTLHPITLDFWCDSSNGDKQIFVIEFEVK